MNHCASTMLSCPCTLSSVRGTLIKIPHAFGVASHGYRYFYLSHPR